MFCANCRLIFKADVIKYPWTADMDPDRETEHNAKYSYTITYRDFLLATTRCHCCLQILLRRSMPEDDGYTEPDDEEYSTAPDDEEYSTAPDDDECGTAPDDEEYSTVPDDDEYGIVLDDEEELRFDMVWKFGEFVRERQAGALSVNVTFREGTLGFASDVFEILPREDHELLQPYGGADDSSFNNTGSAHTAEFVKACLRRCESHIKCFPSSLNAAYEFRGDASWRPTRLVEVSDDGRARLIETSETRPTGPYATLSHCWGTSGTFTTTKKNINDLKKRIPLLDLPKTFREALHFAKNIGISLTWIDSLCIIQDSAEDWDFESRTMLQVYNFAECNLAAAVSEDSHGGLFSERNYASLPSGCFEVENNMPQLYGPYSALPSAYLKDYNLLSDEEKGPRDVWGRREPPEYFKGAFDREMGTSRLLKRGWVYQERAASRRVITFGREHVFWDCSELLESDVLPGYNPFKCWEDRWGNPNYRRGMAVPKCITPAVSPTLKSLDDAFLAWQEIVQCYSACDFTYMTDKPVAILGVAAMMGSAQKIDLLDPFTPYWGGLWLRDMCRQLAWRVGRAGLRKNGHAPSWSWLSIEGPVEWQPFALRSDDATSVLATIAWPNMRAKESDYKIFNEVSSDLKIWCSLHTFRVTDSWGSWNGGSYRRVPSEQLLYMTSSKGIGLDLDPTDLDCEDTDTRTLYFLPLVYNYVERYRRRYRNEPMKPQKVTVVGILVQPTDESLGTYRRCGSVYYSLPDYFYPFHQDDDVMDGHTHEKTAWIRRKFRLSRPPPSSVGFSYQKYDPELGYLIHII